MELEPIIDVYNTKSTAGQNHGEVCQEARQLPSTQDAPVTCQDELIPTVIPTENGK